MAAVEFQGVWVRVVQGGTRVRLVEPSATVFEEPLQVVVLEERDGVRVLPIWMGRSDAFALLRHQRGMAEHRPIPATVMAGLLDAAGARVDHVAITSFRENVYSAAIYLQVEGRSVEVDARPSDALNLAARADVPVLVAEEVMREAAFPAGRLPERLEELLRAGLDTPLEPGDWQPLSSDLIRELKDSLAA